MIEKILNPSKSEFLNRCNYFYLKLDGTYDFPNSKEGDLLKIGMKEIEFLLELFKQQLETHDGKFCRFCGDPIHGFPNFCPECGIPVRRKD